MKPLLQILAAFALSGIPLAAAGKPNFIIISIDGLVTISI